MTNKIKQSANFTIASIVKKYNRMGNPQFIIKAHRNYLGMDVHPAGEPCEYRTKANAGWVYRLESLKAGDVVAMDIEIDTGKSWDLVTDIRRG